MKKDLGVIFGLFLVVMVLIIFGGSYSSTVFLEQNKQSFASNKEASSQATVSSFVGVTSGSLSVQAEVAKTPDTKKKGLGGRESLDLDRGMLFVFESSANQTFWMRDMKFAIDIIWIGEDKKILHIAENVPPEPGKKDSELMRYSPPAPAKYVLEINAGLTRLNNLKLGDSVDFTL